MSQTTVASCGKPSCKNDWQDSEYGKFKRVMNKSMKGLVCTVCGGVRVADTSTSKKK